MHTGGAPSGAGESLTRRLHSPLGEHHPHDAGSLDELGAHIARRPCDVDGATIGVTVVGISDRILLCVQRDAVAIRAAWRRLSQRETATRAVTGQTAGAARGATVVAGGHDPTIRSHDHCAYTSTGAVGPGSYGMRDAHEVVIPVGSHVAFAFFLGGRVFLKATSSSSLGARITSPFTFLTRT